MPHDLSTGDGEKRKKHREIKGRIIYLDIYIEVNNIMSKKEKTQFPLIFPSYVFVSDRWFEILEWA